MPVTRFTVKIACDAAFLKIGSFTIIFEEAGPQFQLAAFMIYCSD